MDVLTVANEVLQPTPLRCFLWQDVNCVQRAERLAGSQIDAPLLGQPPALLHASAVRLSASVRFTAFGGSGHYVCAGLHSRPRLQRLPGCGARSTALPRIGNIITTNSTITNSRRWAARRQECIEPPLVRCQWRLDGRRRLHVQCIPRPVQYLVASQPLPRYFVVEQGVDSATISAAARAYGAA